MNSTKADQLGKHKYEARVRKSLNKTLHEGTVLRGTFAVWDFHPSNPCRFIRRTQNDLHGNLIPFIFSIAPISDTHQHTRQE